uniref:Selenoprotein W n=1 Tax=Trepomonas sp. PC1 TaxID=1076344 RepID=A0A146KGE1_9EUKA|eukprot:JAP94705.1 Selenoprotein W [Trepomonas sp. PC1]
MPRYKGLEGFMKSKGFEIDMEYGNSGDFEIFADGKLIFSKQEQHRYPNPPEVLAAVESLGK